MEINCEHNWHGYGCGCSYSCPYYVSCTKCKEPQFDNKYPNQLKFYKEDHPEWKSKINMQEELQKMYDSEINVRIQCFWDGGLACGSRR